MPKEMYKDLTPSLMPNPKHSDTPKPHRAIYRVLKFPFLETAKTPTVSKHFTASSPHPFSKASLIPRKIYTFQIKTTFLSTFSGS
jgi:hypothetical protein